MTSKLSEKDKKFVIETEPVRPPKFSYLDQFKNDMEEILIQLTKKEPQL